MYTLKPNKTKISRPSKRSLLSPGPIILLLGLAAILYIANPYLSSATTLFASSLRSSLRSQKSFCTKAVGEGICCELHLGAEPCLDECRKEFMDRQTFQLTKEYEECADKCLVVYQSTCGEKVKEWEARSILAAQQKQDLER